MGDHASGGVAQACLGYLLSAGLRGGVLLALVALATLALGRRSAGVRHLLWASGLGGLAVITGASWLLPAWQVAALPPATLSVVGLLGGEGARAAPPMTVMAAGGARDASSALGMVADGAPVVAPAWAPALLLAVWAVVALGLLARLLLGLVAATRLVRHSAAVTDPVLLSLASEAGRRAGLRRAVPLRLSDAVDSPVTTGVWRPVVLLPAAATDWDCERLAAVLVHELAHVRRRDCGSQLLARVLTAIHWWNPLCWLAERRMVVEREQTCDDHVLAAGTRPSAYAGHLLAIGHMVAGGQDRRPATAVSGAFIVGCSRLAGRIETLLDARRSHRLPGRRAVAGVLAAGLLLALPAACLTGDNFGGSGSSRLVYRTDPGQRDRAAEVLARRLNELDLGRARITRQHADQLVVELPPRARHDEAAVRAVLERAGSLSLTIVDTEHAYNRRLAAHVAADPEAARQSIRVGHDSWRVVDGGPTYDETFVEGPRASLERYLAELPAALRPPATHRLVVDVVNGAVAAGDSRGRTFLCDGTRSVRPSRLADATALASDLPDWFMLRVVLGPEDAARTHQLTTANVGRRMLIEMDGRDVWGAPVIQSPFSERVRLTARGAVTEGERLAAGLRAESLPTPLELVSQ